MKKLFLSIVLLCTLCGNAQVVTTYSVYDSNQSGDVNVSDVTTVVDKLKANVAASNTQQYVTADDLSKLINSLITKIDRLENNQKLLKQKLGLDPNEEFDPDDVNLLPGKFTVAEGKLVRFAKSNLYWDGSEFKFEANQTDYPTAWDANHVGHFYWTNLTDYQSGKSEYKPYDKNYAYSSLSDDDKFWCGEDNKLTVEGTNGLYVLTSDEWNYLISKRTNASNLCKYGVTVTNSGMTYTNCVIIASDDFIGTLQSTYALDDVNAAGFVCLPAAGRHEYYLTTITNSGDWGMYWSSKPASSDSKNALELRFYSGDIFIGSGYRNNGHTLRLVKTVSE